MTNHSGRSTNTRDPRGWTNTGKRYKRWTARYLRRRIRQTIHREDR